MASDFKIVNARRYFPTIRSRISISASKVRFCFFIVPRSVTLYNTSMRAEIICIGTELLLGDIVNTNAAFLSRKLSEIGVDMYHQVTVGDNPRRLIEALRSAASRADIVLTSGGLGPTVDDITMETVGRLIGSPMVTDKGVLRDIKAYFKARHVRFPCESTRQAIVPRDATLIRNKVGSAPGLISDYLGAKIICLPGPPREIEAMFTNDVVPYLKKTFGLTQAFRSRTIKITGLPESRVDGIIHDLLQLNPPTTVGIYAKLGQVELKIMSKAPNAHAAERAISKVEREIRKRLGDHIFGVDDETLESAVGALLKKMRLTIAIAESCTGGLVTHRLTNVSGSSDYFMMGLVAYSNQIKERILGVPPELLAKYGAVSEEVALRMAKGIRFLARTNIGIGITGIAGPTGGTAKKPVGLVYIALAAGKKHIVRECRFLGSREEIKHQASQAALNLIRKQI